MLVGWWLCWGWSGWMLVVLVWAWSFGGAGRVRVFWDVIGGGAWVLSGFGG